jgi:hypothetical protein
MFGGGIEAAAPALHAGPKAVGTAEVGALDGFWHVLGAIDGPQWDRGPVFVHRDGVPFLTELLPVLSDWSVGVGLA